MLYTVQLIVKPQHIDKQNHVHKILYTSKVWNGAVSGCCCGLEQCLDAAVDWSSVWMLLWNGAVSRCCCGLEQCLDAAVE